MDNNLST